MKSRESAAIQTDAIHDTLVHPHQEKSDPLVQRYLGAALFTALAGLDRSSDRQATEKGDKPRRA